MNEQSIQQLQISENPTYSIDPYIPLVSLFSMREHGVTH